MSQHGYGFRAAEIEPVDGCADCAEYAEQVRAAGVRGDRSALTDQRVLLRRHQDAEHA